MSEHMILWKLKDSREWVLNPESRPLAGGFKYWYYTRNYSLREQEGGMDNGKGRAKEGRQNEVALSSWPR